MWVMQILHDKILLDLGLTYLVISSDLVGISFTKLYLNSHNLSKFDQRFALWGCDITVARTHTYSSFTVIGNVGIVVLHKFGIN